MSNYVDAAPDIDRILKLGKSLETQFRDQEELDTMATEFYLLKNKGDAAVTKAMQKKKIKPVRTGMLKRRIDRDFNLTLQTPSIRFNPRTSKKEDAEFADTRLEPWIAGVWRLSQTDDVWGAMNRNLHILGRAVSSVSPLPRLWADGPYKKLLARLRDAGDDPDETAAALAAVEAYKLRNFPIRWRRENARSAYPVFSSEYRLPEVLKKRKLTKAQIVTDYGSKALPDNFADQDGSVEVTVWEYDNWEYSVTIAESETDPRMLRPPWQHGMEMNPNILMELERLDYNEFGLYWAGAMFSVLEMAEAFDEFMTDLRHNVRSNTIRGRLFGLDAESRGISGPPEQISVQAGDDLTLYLKEAQAAGLMPAPDLQPQAFSLAQLLQGEIDKAMTISALDEQARSGHSAATYTEGVQVARSRFNSVQDAQYRAARQFAMAALSCVNALSKGLGPEEADTVWVVMGRDENMQPKGSVGLAPKDVEGWISEALIEPQFGPGLLTAQSLLISMAMQVSGPPLNLPLEYTLPTFLGIENTRYWIDKIDGNRLDQTYVEPVIGKLVALALERAGLAMTPQETAELAASIGQLPPEAAAALMGAPPQPQAAPAPQGPVGPGGVIAENVGRAGQVQTPPVPEGMVI